MSAKGSAENARTKYIDRNQQVLHVIDIERLIDAEHPARLIWEFVGTQKLERFYEGVKAIEGVAGRECWDPRMLITMWIYAYSEGISAAREISRLCEYHPGFQWITGLRVVNHRTLSGFRSGHGEALHQLFVDVLGAMQSQGLITMSRVMHDGTRIAADASKSSFHREGTIVEHLREAEEQVQAMEAASETEVGTRVEAARRRAAKEKVERLRKAAEELEKVRANKKSAEEKKEARVSSSDPEARTMKHSDGSFKPSYNAQISTDAEKTIIVGVEISQSGNDVHELVDAVDRVEMNTGKRPGQMVVDGAYVSAGNIIAMEEKKIELFAPAPDNEAKTAGLKAHSKISPAFQADAFSYDPDRDAYTCPAGKNMRYTSTEISGPNTCFTYRADFRDCKSCSYKADCCPGNKSVGRSVTRREPLPEVKRFAEKMETESAKEIYKQRSPVAEFPNLWLKEKFKLRRFRLRSAAKVKMEALWACLAYNLKQMFRLLKESAAAG